MADLEKNLSGSIKIILLDNLKKIPYITHENEKGIQGGLNLGHSGGK